jgi:hypothetical protein
MKEPHGARTSIRPHPSPLSISITSKLLTEPSFISLSQKIDRKSVLCAVLNLVSARTTRLPLWTSMCVYYWLTTECGHRCYSGGLSPWSAERVSAVPTLGFHALEDRRIVCVCERVASGLLGTEQDGAERLLNCIMRQHKARSGDCGLHYYGSHTHAKCVWALLRRCDFLADWARASTQYTFSS